MMNLLGGFIAAAFWILGAAAWLTHVIVCLTAAKWGF